MPKRKRGGHHYGSQYKRRRTKRRQWSAKKYIVNLSRFKSTPFPNSIIAKHRYCDHTSLNATTGTTPVSINFRANGIYDPDYQAGGHQPLGFDEYIALYDHWIVLGSKITVTFDTTTTVSQLVGITLDDNETSAVTFQEEKPRTCYRVLGNSDQSRGIVRLTKKFSHKNFFSQPGADANYRGTQSTDPSEQAHFHIWIKPLNPVDDPAPTNLHVTIEYIVKWFEPRTISAS